MVQPLRDVYVTAAYGIKGSWSAGYHTGVDYRAPVGTPIMATAAGKVVGVGNLWGSAYGTQVIIETNGVRHGYCHLSRVDVRVGQTVKAGQVIALSGNTGNTTGPHLHYEERLAPWLYNNKDRRPQFPDAGATPPADNGDRFYSRDEWDARPPGDGPGRLDPGKVEGLAFHWPAMSKPLRGVAAVSAALRSWQDYHMDTLGWSDIGYQAAIDQDGNRYQLRSMEIQSGANGNQDVNERFGALLLILGPGEKPTDAMVAAIHRFVVDFRKMYPKATQQVGHNEVRPEPTACPGPIAQGLIDKGAFEPAATKPDPKPKPKPDPKPDPDPAPPKVDYAFTVAAMSGLWNAPNDAWDDALDRAIKATRRYDSSVVIGTEMTRRAIPRKIIDEGWDYDQVAEKPGQSDMGILWLEDLWESAGPAYAYQLTTTLWYTEDGKLRPPHYGLVKPLRFKANDEVVLFGGFHAPPTIDGGDKLSNEAPRRTEAGLELLTNLPDMWQPAREDHPDAGRVVAFDLNLNMRKPWVRDLWAEHNPKLTLCWNDQLPNRGTHGEHRVIDGTGTGGRLALAGTPRVLKLSDDFDHRTVVVPHGWPKP